MWLQVCAQNINKTVQSLEEILTLVQLSWFYFLKKKLKKKETGLSLKETFGHAKERINQLAMYMVPVELSIWNQISSFAVL